jgi:hypothetical protein
LRRPQKNGLHRHNHPYSPLAALNQDSVGLSPPELTDPAVTRVFTPMFSVAFFIVFLLSDL